MPVPITLQPRDRTLAIQPTRLDLVVPVVQVSVPANAHVEPTRLDLVVPGVSIAMGGSISAAVLPTELDLVVPVVTIAGGGAAASVAPTRLVLVVPAVTVLNAGNAHVEPTRLDLVVPVVTLSLSRQVLAIEPTLLDLVVPSTTIAYSGSASFAVAPTRLDLVVPGVPEHFPGPYPAGFFFPFTTGGEARPATPGDDGLAFAVPDVEPISVGEPPVDPVLLETVEIRYERRRRRARSGVAILSPTATKLRPVYRVRWSGLTYAERELLRAWFRDEVQGKRYAMTLRVDGPGTPTATFRAIEDARNQALAVGVYDVAELLVEETFQDPGG